MKHIVLLNPKGGCGKTTIATHIAVYASTMGHRVALVDHDQQQSSHDWIKSRPKRCADIGVIAAYNGEVLEGEYDVLVHDMPGASVEDQLSVASVCDKLIIPITPSPIDIKAALRLWVTLSNIGWLDNKNMDIGMIANRVKSKTKYLSTFDSFIKRTNIPRIATLRDTQNYIRSLDAGLTLFDLPPNQVAKDLVQWQPIMEWTGLFDLEDDELDILMDFDKQSESSEENFISLEEMNYDKQQQEEEGFNISSEFYE